jgi:hypothetical protein
VSVATGTRTPAATYAIDLTIGAATQSPTPYNWFPGSVAAVAIYNAALTSTQINNHWWAALGTLTLGTRTKTTAPILQSAWSPLLVAYNLGEGSGSATDLSGNGHTGTLTGGCTWSSGSYGNQLSLADNGTTGSYLSIGNLSALSGVTEWTFSALCQLNAYTDAPRGNNIRTLIGTSRVGAAFPQSSISYNSTTQTIRFSIRYNNFTDIIAPAPALNQWILITARVTAAHEASLWYDGIKVAATTNASFQFAGDVTPVGGVGDTYVWQPGNNWSGLISMGLMATRGFTDAEIAALAADPFVWDRYLAFRRTLSSRVGSRN